MTRNEVIREARRTASRLRGQSYRKHTGEGPVFNAETLTELEVTEACLPEADASTVKTSRRKGFSDPDWSVLDDEQLMRVADNCARSVAKEFRDKQVTMLCEYDDLRQEALVLAARALGADPEFPEKPENIQRNHIWRALRDQVKYRIEPASATVYQSTLEASHGLLGSSAIQQFGASTAKDRG